MSANASIGSVPASSFETLLAIETSCDDTCAAVVTNSREVKSNVISSQGIHDRYGGVVPEWASRHHLELIEPIIAEALELAQVDSSAIDAVAVTRGPGLIGALLVGFSAAKAYAAAWGKPLIPVDHLQGHVSANFLLPDPIDPPFLCLVASGGHTMLCHVTERVGYEVIGQTLDDAAGEAFDKGARLLGLGFPGGAEIEQLAGGGNDKAFDFPRAAPGGLDFSFSGLKTALLYKVREFDPASLEDARADLAASYQLAIVDALVARVEQAIKVTGIRRVAIGGGVAANTLLRDRIGALEVTVNVPDRSLCTDNAAMIGCAAHDLPALAYPDYLGLDAYPSGTPPE